MKVKLIYNPVSGSGTFKENLDYIIEKFQDKGYELSLFRTRNKESLKTMMSKLNKNEYVRILVAGGDGTINQVVNLMLEHNIDLPLGIFPVGTANDYARYFNLPKDIKEATEIVLRNNYTPADVGCVNNKHFINVASLGFLVDVSQKVSSSTKNNMGILSCYLKGLEELPTMKPIKIKVSTKEFNLEEEILFMLILNGKSAGGFNKISPFSSINDGFLDVFIFKKCPVIELPNLFLKVMKGEHIKSSYVTYFQTDSLVIDCKEKVGTDLDGEKGVEFPLNITTLPKKLNIITKFNNEDGFSNKRVFSFHDVKIATKQTSKGIVGELKKPIREFNSERNLFLDMLEIVKDLTKHDSFNYVNKGSLSQNYYDEVKKALDDRFLYIVLSSTGSPAGEIIGKVTKKQYSHVSLSFDEELKTIISYNGGNKLYNPGLNQEMLEYFHQKEDANIIIYKIEATKEQKEKILKEIKRIDQQGSSYNALGLIMPYSHQENIMFCCQFVYKMLELSSLAYFEKRAEKVKPTDFVELDYERKLKYHDRLFLKNLVNTI